MHETSAISPAHEILLAIGGIGYFLHQFLNKKYYQLARLEKESKETNWIELGIESPLALLAAPALEEIFFRAPLIYLFESMTTTAMIYIHYFSYIQYSIDETAGFEH